MASLGLLFAGFSIVLPLVLFGLLVVVVVGVSTARNEPDPHNHRLPATYLTAVSFVLVFTALFGLTAAVASVSSLIGEEDSFSVTAEPDFGDDFEPRSETPLTPVDDSDVEDATAGALAGAFVVVVAGGMLWHHRRTLLGLLDAEGFRGGAGARVVHAYLYATQFVAVLVLVGAGAVTLYGLAQVLVPGLLSDGEAQSVREGGARLFLTAGALAGGAGLVAAVHLREHERVDRSAPPPPVV
ncbi:MAG TPA: hypothetical protein VHF47_02220 [Acidimicrobiales bacterium]|nr:hypothetical protein [Acidimicrobiales bacterium]